MSRSLVISFIGITASLFAAPAALDIEQAPHFYSERTPRDRFTLLKKDFENGRIPLDHTSEKAFLVSLLHALQVPVSSQMLVFSNTSLQLRLISPSNPRALYFNEDMYVGYVPGGRIEIVSLDPELGAIFYIFDIPRDGQPPRVERSDRCMNCHAGPDTQEVPGLTLKSVVPGSTGGSLKSFRQEQTGHEIPLSDRFGGWYVTGGERIGQHWGNVVGPLSSEGAAVHRILAGQRFNPDRYPLPTSDVLPQLLHEHQAGFVNRVVGATYRARTILHEKSGAPAPADAATLDTLARGIVRYLLFAGEAPLPAGGVDGSAEFKADFLRQRRSSARGESLKDFDLRTRLFRHRCSYMIYSPVFGGMPPPLKERVMAQLGDALSVEKPHREFAYLAANEKRAIRAVLRETLRELPSGW